MEAQPSSLSSSSSSSSCSTNDNVAQFSFSSDWTEFNKTELVQAVNQEKASIAMSETGLLRFIDFKFNGGMKWEDVEEQFDWLAISYGQAEPVIKWSDIGLCIGMKHSQEFLYQLLRALRKNKDWKFGVTKAELRSFWCHVTDPYFNSRMQMFFDINMEGRITKIDMKHVIILGATTNKLFLTTEEAEEYGALVMEQLDTEKRGYIELPEFEALFRMTCGICLMRMSKMVENW